jgi:hypothetical protein
VCNLAFTSDLSASGRGVSGSLGAIFVRLGAFDKEELLEKQGEEAFALSIL